jgi:two-component system, chemotaxis family, CheB/CheR fusion protein
LIELASVIEEAMEVVRVSAEAKNIQVESRLDHSTRKLSVDSTRIQQVVWNLLSNAIKFTPEGGRIEVTLKYDAQAEIQVIDTGRGISADFLPYVFDRFSQADSSKTRVNTGLGLGLSIVRHLVELHGGTVHAESQGEEQGATFTVRLPLPQTNSQDSLLSVIEPVVSTEVPERLLANISSLEAVRVLVVDDEANIRELFTTVLEVYGVEVTAVASAKGAISALLSSPGRYDVLLSDIGMPEENGYMLIRQVRALSAEAGGQIPAAALTAYVRDEEYQEAIAAGFQVHLAKPITPEQLLLVVASLAGRIGNA